MIKHQTVFPFLLPLAASLTLTGCGSLTGLDAASSFSCPMTPGAACRSLSDTYDDTINARHPDQVARAEAEREAAYQAQMEGDAAAADAIRFESDLEDDIARAAAESSKGSQEPLETQDREGNKTAAATPAAAAGSFAPDLSQADAVKHAIENPSAGMTARSGKARSVNRVRIPDGHAPQRVPEIIVTIWIAPWTDDEGDFHEGERIHARAFDARWAAARRRADNVQGRRAVVQLPFDRRPAISAKPVTSDAPRATRSFGLGAAALQGMAEKAAHLGDGLTSTDTDGGLR